MRHMFRLGLVLSCVLVAAVSDAQTPRPDTVRDVLLARWNDIGEKVVTLAAEFPEDKYDFRPVPGVRTFAEQLRHVAFWNLFVVKSARGEKIDPAINELAKTDYPTKSAIVAILKQTLAAAAAELKKRPAVPPARDADLYVSFIEHSGEHYGQMVVYYRLNGIVPPSSR
jgi:hypothetical protein